MEEISTSLRDFDFNMAKLDKLLKTSIDHDRDHDRDDFKADSLCMADQDDQDEVKDTACVKPVHTLCDDAKEEPSKDDIPSNSQQVQGDCLDTMFTKQQRFVVRLRGLPWSARETAIEKFFGPSSKNKEIQIVYLTDGRVSGEALVEFDDEASYRAAFSKNRQHIGHRYIEIFNATPLEIDTAAGRATEAPPRPPQSRFIIRMRGLPYTATDEDVSRFFGETKPTSIHLIKDDLGRPSGEGFVELSSEVDSIAAMTKHRHHMGHRYIELFRSSKVELIRALGLTSGWQPANECSVKSSCILMRGLPYSCTEGDITKFFQEIEVTPIRIHRKADGAEAYVEFCSVEDTDKAMRRHRSYIGNRYIELFRVSFEDMARIVGLPTNIAAPAFSANVAAAAVCQSQPVVNPAMTTSLTLPPLSITPHYGSMAPSAQCPLHEMRNGQFGGSQYMANALPFLTGIYGQPQAAAFQNMPTNHGHYDRLNLGAQQQSYYPTHYGQL